MDLIRLLRKKWECELFVTGQHPEIRRLLEDEAFEESLRNRMARVKTDEKFRSALAQDVNDMTKYFEKINTNSIFPIQFLLDMERTYVYFLFCALYVEETEFPELYQAMEGLRKVLNESRDEREIIVPATSL